MDQTSTYSPLVMQETSDGLRLYDIRDEMLAAREIEITGAIDAGSVSTAIRCLLHLQKEDETSSRISSYSSSSLLEPSIPKRSTKARRQLTNVEMAPAY